MKCPFCGSDMQSGFLQSGQNFHWGPERDERTFRVSKGFWNGCWAEGFFCKDCGKIILSVEEKK